MYALHSANYKIIRVGSFAYPRKNALYRSMNYLSYAIIATIIALMTKSDFIVAMTDPPLSGFIGAITAKIKRKPFIHYIQDLHPEMAIASGMVSNGFVIKIWEAIQRWVLQRADKIVVIGDDMRERLVNKGIDKGKLVVIRHGAATYRSVDPTDYELMKTIRDKFSFTFMHAGNIGYYGEWESIIEAIKRIENNDIGFIFVGEGQNRQKIVEACKFVKNIKLLPFQPREKVKAVINSGDIHIITIKKGLEGLVVPSKLYTILSAHKPILAICPESSDVAKIIKQFNCGLVADPESPDQIAEAMAIFYNNRKDLTPYCENAKAAAEFYDQEEQLKTFKNEIEKAFFLYHA